MALADFENLLKASIGLDVGSIGRSSIERAVQGRLSACGLQSRDVYLARVQGSPAELQALIEAVVVSETWFFRDREAFATLASIGYENWLRGPTDGLLRLLSLPSATGEEPYSMAMALLDAGVPADRFRVDAVDVSALAIALGERAVYGRNSFRGQELAFRDRHFEATPLGHRPSDAVRQQVHFRQGNMFAADFLPGPEIYDVIFCRNLLIYFDRPTQDRAVDVLQRLLTLNGTLFVAPSETGLLLSHDFVSARIPLAFAFRKLVFPREPASALASQNASARQARTLAPVSQNASARQARTLAPVSQNASARQARTLAPVSQNATARQARTLAPVSQNASARQASTAALASQNASARRAPAPSAPEKPAVQHSGLDEAVRLADQGSFAEALLFCEAHLQRHGPSAEAFYLLGLVRDAAGNAPDASNYYRKAIYLDPTHHEALVHLAFLVEQQGNSGAAQVLRTRARRVQQHAKV